MNYVIQCDDAKQQTQVLEKLEKEGYRWSYSGVPTNFVPLSKYKGGNILITQPSMIISYALYLEPVKEKYKNSHKFVTGSEYLGHLSRKVIL